MIFWISVTQVGINVSPKVNLSYAQGLCHVSNSFYKAYLTHQQVLSVLPIISIFLISFSDCDTKDDTATLLASELLVSQLQPVFTNIIARDQFATSVFPFSDREEPRGLLDINEFQMLYARTIELYNVLPSVCPQSVFELCNTDGDQFVSLDEVYICGGSKA